ACGSPRIRYLGGGTERVEREVRERFPALRVGRLDRDVVEHRGAAERVTDAFAERRLDVLVGTSLVAKGIDVPNVTLVGGAMADDLRRRAADRGLSVAVVGPAPAYVARRSDRWRWNVVLRGEDPVALLDGGLDAPWSVDVDPESLL